MKLMPLDSLADSRLGKRVPQLAAAWSAYAKRLDYILLFTVATLLTIGLTMVYSSSSIIGYEQFDNPNYFFIRQIAWAALGCIALLVLSSIEYHIWRRLSIPIMAAALFLLIAVLLFGESRFGSQRWLLNGSGQSSEFCKLAIVIYMADWLSSKGERIHKVSYGLVPFAILVGVAAGLIVMQLDLSAAVIITATVVSMLFIAGAKLWQVIIELAVSGATLAFLITRSPFALSRIRDFMEHPPKSFYRVGEKVIISWILGVGMGASSLKFQLFAPHTDSIFAILVEELGLFGGLMVIGLFTILAYRGFKVAMEAPDGFGTILAGGLTCWLIFQAFLNIAMSTAIIPLTGCTLPFISYGGSSLIVSLASIGLLLSISKSTIEEASISGSSS